VLASAFSGAGLAQAPAAEVVIPEPETGEYIIGVEDRLSVAVWREPDLVRTVIVRPDGKITFPLVGDIQASGRSASELDTQITAALEKFIKEPVVSVIVEEINNFKIYLIGEVARQGEIILRRRTRLLQAIALAGGLTAYADKSKVTIIRDENGREVRINIDYRRVASGERPESNIFLKPGDTIVAN
jgi:polysaccharide export outer membrane protein